MRSKLYTELLCLFMAFLLSACNRGANQFSASQIADHACKLSDSEFQKRCDGTKQWLGRLIDDFDDPGAMASYYRATSCLESQLEVSKRHIYYAYLRANDSGVYSLAIQWIGCDKIIPEFVLVDINGEVIGRGGGGKLDIVSNSNFTRADMIELIPFGDDRKTTLNSSIRLEKSVDEVVGLASVDNACELVLLIDE